MSCFFFVFLLTHVLFYPAERVVVVGSENAEMVDG
jgi:hypothetical protein